MLSCFNLPSIRLIKKCATGVSKDSKMRKSGEILWLLDPTKKIIFTIVTRLF